jgi:anti-sigma regulatory factor (Ser/Thr protein kinase)
MRFSEFLTGGGFDFAAADEHFAAFLADNAAWLGAADAYRVRLGLHELLVNIRKHAYAGGEGAIEIGGTVSATALILTVTDWGTILPTSAAPQMMPLLSAHGGYGLAIIDQAFSEVAYRRGAGRNEWLLTRSADRVSEK